MRPRPQLVFRLKTSAKRSLSSVPSLDISETVGSPRMLNEVRED
jgi:hypothetical protein